MPANTTLTPSQAAAAAAASQAAAVAHAIKHKGEHDYPIDIGYFIVATIGLACALNVFSIIWAFWRRQTMRRGPVTSRVNPSNGQVSLLRLPSAVLTASRIFAYRWRIPAVNMSLLEILITCIYLMALLIWTFANTQDLVIKNWSDRSGHIAAAQLPLIVALSMKNNVIGYLTGLSHEKLHILHRTFSRAVFVECWIHAFSRVSVQAWEITEFGWTILGLTCGIIYTVILLLSIKPIRARWFEYFYLVHVTLVFAFILITYLHCAASNFGYYVWPCFLVWGVDRVGRYLRYLILTDFRSPSNPANKAELELIDDDTIRVTARRHMPLGWTAGSHMYIALPTIGPIESHPFSIASISSDEGNKDGKEIIFVFRARKGFTRRVKEYVMSQNGSCRVPIFMHGPYGAAPDITPFSTCVFISGGSGITYTLPRLRHLLNRAAKDGACARRIIFVWSVRKRSHISWVDAEIKKAFDTASSVPDLAFTFAVYVTGTGPSVETLDDGASGLSTPERDPEKDGSFDDQPSPKTSFDVSMHGVEISLGRPDIPKILEEAVKNSDGPVSVDVSGPNALIDGVRSTLSSSFASPIGVLKGMPSVHLHVEHFSI